MNTQIANNRLTHDEVFKAVALVAAKGYKLVRVYGLAHDGVCECKKGAQCPSPGKHPVGNEWQNRATTDEREIASWFEDEERPVPNVGVLLGEVSGVIDVEADTEKAVAALKRWGLDQIDTPAFQSGRSPHYLFQWEPGLPEITIVKPDGIECRLGNEGAAQSLIPPSWHASGVAREWLPGRSPAECELQPLPREFREAIVRAGGGKGKSLSKAATEATAAGKVFHEGEGRHAYLLGAALNQARKEPNLTSDESIEAIHQIVLALNDKYCRPPYPERDVRVKTDDAIAWVRRTREAGVPELNRDDPNAEGILAAQRTPWERAGLRRSGNDWHPGDWRVACVHSDPRRYRLTVPAPDGSGLVYVNLNAEEWLTPSKVARKMLAATGTVNMCDPSPTTWAKVWSGFSVRNDGGQWDAKRGLSAQLLENPYITHEYPPPELSRAATVAGLLYGHLAQVRRPTDEKDDKVSNSGSAKWRYFDGRPELCFVWNVVWTEINESAETRVTGEEKQDLLEKLLKEVGVKEFPFTQAGSSRKRQYRWTDETLRMLARLAGLEDAQ